MDACVDTYLLGTRQKLCVLLALLGDPTLVLLDEAFNGLDPNSSLVLKQHLHQRLDAGRCSVLLATHALDMIECHAEAAGLLLNGKIAKCWSSEDIRQLRNSGSETLERELAMASSLV